MEITIGEQLAAARRARVEDAHILLMQNRFGGAAYLGGYAAELALAQIVMKMMNFSGGSPKDWRIFFGAATAKAASMQVEESPELYHNPVFWALLLTKLVEKAGGEKLKKVAAARLRDARRLREIWSVDLRYEMRSINPAMAWEILEIAARFERTTLFWEKNNAGN